MEETTPSPAEPTPSVSPVTPEEPKAVFDAKDIADNKYVALLSYLGVLFLIPLLAKRDSPFAQFHAKQGLVLCILFILAYFISHIPLFGWLIPIFLFVVNVIAFFKTLSGQAWELPLIAPLAKKLDI